MTKDFHEQPFQSSTFDKLDIYRSYLRDWLPVFIAKSLTGVHRVQIFDFFSGPGYDKNGKPGSPIIAANTIKEFLNTINKSPPHIHVYFYDAVKSKIDKLDSALKPYDNLPHATFHRETKPFQQAFDQARKTFSSAANLVFIDQTGIKQVTPELLQYISSFKRTDLLFFLSSSFIRRFAYEKGFINNLNIPLDRIVDCEYRLIHRTVCDEYREKLPCGSNYHLAPYSIKRNGNIHGLIFGTNHILGLDKFIRTCWKADPRGGEANFDIHNDNNNPDQFSLFEETKKPYKVELFQNELREKLLSGTFESDRDVFVYTITRGMLPSHAKSVVTSLIKEKKLRVANNKQPRISYGSYQNPRRLMLQ